MIFFGSLMVLYNYNITINIIFQKKKIEKFRFNTYILNIVKLYKLAIFYYCICE